MNLNGIHMMLKQLYIESAQQHRLNNGITSYTKNDAKGKYYQRKRYGSNNRYII